MTCSMSLCVYNFNFITVRMAQEAGVRTVNQRLVHMPALPWLGIVEMRCIAGAEATRFAGCYAVSLSRYKWRLLLRTSCKRDARACAGWVQRICSPKLYAVSRKVSQSGRYIGLSLADIDSWSLGPSPRTIQFEYCGASVSWSTSRGGIDFRNWVRVLLAIRTNHVFVIGDKVFDLTGDEDELPDEERWAEWSGTDIADWILSLDPEHYRRYYETVQWCMFKEKVDGKKLRSVDDTDLFRFGILSPRHREEIMSEIIILVRGKSSKM